MTKGNISIAPTLVIGLGGTGSKIINNVASLINDANPDLNHKVKYVAFDTDVNELKGIRKKNPNVYTVQTSTSSTVGEYLEVEDYARENWFPVNKIVSRKTLTEGAGQVRAISRLAFNTSLRSGKLSELYKAIDYLFQLEANQQAQTLKIVVVSSLAGGTGSGLILPVGLHLREYLKEKYSRTANIIRGFFILPDVFYSVIPGKEEQSNLNCNAYAAVKELDAFLMRGDGTLDTAKYRDIKFEFPEANSDQVEDIKVMPYDFCTLFDSANTSGKTLSSFSELLNHAATCIYSQIALMSEKINSAEDNTIRALASSKGRARYVGVGASRLVYPYTHIRDYVAYNWAKECISKEWLQYDKDFKKQQVNNQKARNEGHLVKDLHLENVYTDLIEAQIKQKNPFALSISNQCSKLDKDGVTKLEDKWETYIANLEKFSREDTISDELKKSQENTGGKIRDASGSNDGNDWAPVANGCKEYYNLANRSIEQKASSKAYSLFRYDQDENAAAKRDEMFLESYLKDQDNKFIHPNAVRLFLYKLNSSLGEEIVKVENQVKDQEESASFKNLEKEVMKQFSEDAEDDSLSFLSLSEIGAKNNIWSKIFNKVDFSEAKKKFENYFDRVNELLQLKIYFELLKGARGYVQKLNKSFEVFFNNLEDKIDDIDDKLSSLRSTYKSHSGTSTHYVLGEPQYLEKINKNIPYTGGVLSLDSKLSENIYNEVLKYANIKEAEEVKDSSFFSDLFDKTIMGYFKNDVAEKNQSALDIDIFKALEKEYSFDAQNVNSEDKLRYVSDAINDSVELANPFIENPIGEEKHPIFAASYSPELMKTYQNDEKHMELINKIYDLGGRENDLMSKYEIQFYKAIYAISAQDLSKFAPAKESETVTQSAGAYYKAYYKLVDYLSPKMGDSSAITPHLDRRWHYPFMLPDISKKSERIRWEKIDRALFFGLLWNRILMQNQTREDTFYVKNFKNMDEVDDNFVVSNGTPCDHFYEIFDALQIDPIAVTTIINNTNEDIRDYRLQSNIRSFDESSLKFKLDNFKLGKFSNDSVVMNFEKTQYSILFFS